MTIAIGSIITTTRGTRGAVVAPYPAIVPSWSILDRAGIRTSVAESEIDSVELVTFSPAEQVTLPDGTTAAVLDDAGDVVTVQIAHRVPLPSGNHHSWVGESFVGRGELVALNKL